MKQHIFFLGGHDAEMLEIRNILREKEERFFDHHLSWGALLSAYEQELKNLSDDSIPVFIELKPDCQYPQNAILVDHHDEKAGKDRKTSLEQVAGLLGIRLNRYQQLISANDKGHIRGMKALHATEEEISEIRYSDRKAQGVTDDDERLAEASVNKQLEKIGNNTAIIDSLTDKVSAVSDRIYDQYRHIFVFTPDGQMSYSGEGEMVCRLVTMYEKKQNDKPSAEFWWGGDMPDYGFFGTAEPLDKEEIRKMAKDIQKRIISQHIFMFPFRISNQGEKESSPVDIRCVFNEFRNSGWEYKPYNPTDSAANYSEYFYFHEYIRKAIFETRACEEIEELLEKDAAEVISYYFERETDKDSQMVIHIKEDPYNPNTFGPYKLRIDHLSLRLFETGIGMISIEVLNHDYEKMQDVLCINDFGRRIYPQFLAEPESGGIGATKDGFLAERIEFRCKDFQSDEIFSFENYFKKELEVAEYMRNLLGASFLEKFKYVPIIDDRMYTVCWYGSDCWSKKLAEKNAETGELGYESADEWYKYIFVDGKSMGCAPGDLKTELVRKHTYPRWAAWGTFFGVTRYSLMCLTDQGYFGSNIIRNHIQTMYYQIAVILLAQRASVLKFSADVTKISGEIESFVRSDNGEEFKPIEQEIKKLHSAYIRFVNRLWFTEVTPQEQGIEIYTIALEAMGLKDQTEELKDEIRELYEFAKTEEDAKRNKRLSILNTIIFFFMPATLIVALSDFIIGFLPDGEDGEGRLIAGLLIFLMIALSGYAASRKLLEADYEDEIEKLIRPRTFYDILSQFWVFIPFLLALWIVIKIIS